MLNSVVIRGLIVLTSEYLICLSSGLGWTVMLFAIDSSEADIRHVAASGVSDCCYLIYVYA